MENYPGCLFYLEFSIALMHKTLTNQNTAFLCERNYGKFSRLRAGRIIYIRELKQATFLSTRTPTGSKSRRYRWRMMVSAVLV